MAFAKNIKDTCKGRFFGTCSDGKQIYTMLFDRQTHSFGMRDPKTGTYAEAGKYTKEYTQAGEWEQDAKFGMPVNVLLESFEQPQTEYLVPFERVVEIMETMGFVLEDTALFENAYTEQKDTILNEQQQSFSFLNRTFVFRRESEMKEPKEEEAVEVPVDDLPPLEQDTENFPEEPAPPAPTKPRFKSLTTQLGTPAPPPVAEEPAPPPPAPPAPADEPLRPTEPPPPPEPEVREIVVALPPFPPFKNPIVLLIFPPAPPAPNVETPAWIT